MNLHDLLSLGCSLLLQLLCCLRPLIYHSLLTIPVLTMELPSNFLTLILLGLRIRHLGVLLVALMSAVPVDAVSDEGLGAAWKLLSDIIRPRFNPGPPEYGQM